MGVRRYNEFDKDWTEGQLLEMADWEQKLADMAEAKIREQERLDQIRYEFYYGSDRNYEQEDLQLVADLRDLANRIERRYK